MTLSDIAVGIDGSDESIEALRWAAALAEATSASVRAVMAWEMPLIAALPAPAATMPSQAFMATQTGERAEKAVAAAGLAGTIATAVREGKPGEALAEETAIADLTVVGRTGLGRRHGLSRVAEIVLGSTARYCLHHAQGPVAAVPSGSHWVENPTVIVGVDGSESSHAALAWAVENMPAGATIYAVRAVPPYLEGLLALDQQVFDLVLENATNELTASVEGVLGGDGSSRAEVKPLVVVEPPRHALVKPGFNVDLIVVGERGRSPAMARFLGSVSDHTVRHATCPVVVVPHVTTTS